MNQIALPPLGGHNPLGLFAALGALDVATRLLPERQVTLHWTDAVVPTAVIAGPDSLDHLVELCDRDRARWATSPVLTWGPNGKPLDDLKPDPDTELPDWLDAVYEHCQSNGDWSDLYLLGALVAEGATAGKGDSKPTHFHFTAGRQKFLVMVRELCELVDAERFTEALQGPWRYDSTLPVLDWDIRGERIHALTGIKPADSKKTGVPGADWLGFLGLRFFPVAARRGQLLTTGCSPGWKEGHFTWPLWDVPLSAPVVASLLADGTLGAMGVPARRSLGIHHLWRAPIRRADQGGYGSFGAPDPRRDGAPGKNPRGPVVFSATSRRGDSLRG